MSRVRYRISRLADTDFDDIWDYTVRRWSRKQAQRHMRKIFEGIELIADNGVKGRPIGNIRNGYLFTKVNSHFIFYRKGENGIIEIVRVLHERLAIDDRLKK